MLGVEGTRRGSCAQWIATHDTKGTRRGTNCVKTLQFK
jgi:hypothetical protein